MHVEKLSVVLNAIKAKAKENKVRQLVVLVGGIDWSHQVISTSYNKNEIWHVYSDKNELQPTVNQINYRHKLGTECHGLVFQDDHFNVDAFSALSGTVIAGGICFILFPRNFLSSEIYQESYFLQRFWQKLTTDKSVVIINQNQTSNITQLTESLVLPNIIKKASNYNAPLTPYLNQCLTQEQFQAAQAVIKVVKGHRNRPLMLTADRGRGKSSALAIACAKLLSRQQDKQHIVITAPHRQSVDVFFTQLQRSLALEKVFFQKNKLTHHNGVVEFIAIDQLINDDLNIHLLLVDEAAGIPVYLLTQLAHKYHRLVFSSTVHGYEGAGRGFSIKFLQILERIFPQRQLLHINEPIRWAQNDPLEAFVFNSCLLNTDLKALNTTKFNPLQCKSLQQLNSFSHVLFQRIKATDLLENEDKLKEVFSILITAHYQTSPNDLKMLLDNPNLHILTLSQNEVIISVALLMVEGEETEEEVKNVYQRKRKLKNQFIPQSLLTHCGLHNSFDYRYFRILRIAIHPGLQREGLGSYFLEQISTYAQTMNIDCIGASFGVNESLLSFWQQASFKLSRVGFKKDKASGEHSALLLKAINEKGNEVVNKLEKVFHRDLQYWLTEEFTHLPGRLVWQILQTSSPVLITPLSTEDLYSIKDYANGHRQYSCCIYSIYQWLVAHMREPLDDAVLPIIARVFQKKSIERTCREYNFTGSKMLNTHIQNYIKKHLP